MTGDSNHPEPSGESISGSIDQACDRFEAAWREGQRPRIEQYWGGFSGAARTELFVELLLMELELRRRAGEQPQLEEYRGRFPEYDQQIEAMLGEESTRNIRGGGGKVYRDLPTTAATLQYDGAGAGSEAPEGAPVGQERFRRIRFHRRGGLGEIWLAQHRELSQHVAPEELREVHREKVEHRLHFVAEAKITRATLLAKVAPGSTPFRANRESPPQLAVAKGFTSAPWRTRTSNPLIKSLPQGTFPLISQP